MLISEPIEAQHRLAALQDCHGQLNSLRGEVWRLRKDAEHDKLENNEEIEGLKEAYALLFKAHGAERERYAKLCILVAAQLCDIYDDSAECIATGDACAAAIRGTADTSEPGLT